MKQEMMRVVQEMVDNGYHLFDETVEQHSERMLSYGFTVEQQKAALKQFLAWKNGKA